jgi:transposase
LNEAQWDRSNRFFPGTNREERRTADRRVISGIVHVLKIGRRWQYCPSVYGTPTVYERLPPLDDARDVATAV